MSRTLLVVDGNSLAHRAFHAYTQSQLTSSDGQPRWAVHGFLALLCGVLDKVRPDAVVVGFDDAERNRRRERYEPYKGTRSEKDPALVSQLQAIPKILTELGICVRTLDGWEADDVLGSASAAAEAAGWACVLATSDRDSFQLISLRTRVLRLGSGLDNAVWMDPITLKRGCGVDPDQYLHYAALRGDQSDNLPGVMGVGEKGAAKLLGALGDGIRAFDDAAGAGTLVGSSCGPAMLRKLRMEGAREAFERNLDLMAIRRDLDLELGEEFIHARLEQQAGSVAGVCERWELPSLQLRLGLALQDSAGRVAAEAAARAEAEARFEAQIAAYDEAFSLPPLPPALEDDSLDQQRAPRPWPAPPPDELPEDEAPPSLLPPRWSQTL